jgi:hypothetical protein
MRAFCAAVSAVNGGSGGRLSAGAFMRILFRAIETYI